MPTRGPSEKYLIKCSRCGRELKACKFRIYTYQPVKNGQPFGEKIRNRVSNCYDCVRETSKKNLNTLTASNLEKASLVN